MYPEINNNTNNDINNKILSIPVLFILDDFNGNL